ncbi:MAG: hypothetical protein DRP11_00575, partial [Candidatus Aenigmatarchaeota archaeon]
MRTRYLLLLLVLTLALSKYGVAMYIVDGIEYNLQFVNKTVLNQTVQQGLNATYLINVTETGNSTNEVTYNFSLQGPGYINGTTMLQVTLNSSQSGNPGSWTILEVNVSNSGEVLMLTNLTAVNSTNSSIFFTSYDNLNQEMTTTSDSTPPRWYNNTTSPSSPVYSPGAMYQFNITWIDGVNVGTVIFEFNHQNYTYPYVQSYGNVYHIELTDLAANESGYRYRWYASDTAGNWNFTDEMSYVINRSSSSVNISFSPAPSVTYGIQTNSSCYIIQGDGGAILSLERNGSIISSGSEVEDVLVLGAGTYNYTCYYNGSQNYTSSYVTDYLAVSRATPVLSITNTTTITYGNIAYVEGVESDSGDDDCAYNLYRNNTPVNNPDDTLLAAGIYVYIFNTSGCTNYTSGNTSATLTINKSTSSVNISFSPGSDITYGTQSNTTCYVINGDGNVTLLLERNGSQISSGLQAEDVILLGAAVYNYTCYYTETENYTSSYDTDYLTVSRADPSPYMHLTFNGTESDRQITYPEGLNITGWSELLDNQDLVFTLYGYGVNQNGDPIMKDILLGNGTYQYIYNTTGGENYTSGSTPLRTVQVFKGSVPLWLSINGSLSDQTYIYENTTNVTGWSSVSSLSFNLYRNDTSVSSGTPATELALLGAGTYVYVYNTSGNQNYTENTTTVTLTIQKRVPQPSLTITPSAATYGTLVTATCSVFSINGEVSPEFFRNSSVAENGTAVLLPAGAHIYVCNGTETMNYTSFSSQSILTIDKASTLVTLLLNSTDGNYTYERGSDANFTALLNVSGKVIYMDSNITGWILINGTSPLYNLTTLTEIGTFNLTAYFPGDENYTSYIKTHYASVQDTTPPRISSIATSVSYTTATITWNTDESANSTILYGTTSSLGSESSDTNLVMSHYITLTGLSEGTTYYYNITSCDAYENCRTSGIHTFTTNQHAQTSTGGSSGGSSVSVTGGKSHLWILLQPGSAGVMKIEDEEYPVREIEVYVKDVSRNVRIQVMKYDEKPLSLPDLSGTVYSYLEVMTQNLEELDHAKIRFDVKRVWIKENDINESSIGLYRYDNEWERIETRVLWKNDRVIMFESDVSGFSYFAIAGEKVEKVPLPVEKNVTPEEG